MYPLGGVAWRASMIALDVVRLRAAAGRIMDCNRAFSAVTGFSREHMRLKAPPNKQMDGVVLYVVTVWGSSGWGRRHYWSSLCVNMCLCVAVDACGTVCAARA